MNIDLSPIDRRKVKNLGEVLEMNNEVLGLMSRYLTYVLILSRKN